MMTLMPSNDLNHDPFEQPVCDLSQKRWEGRPGRVCKYMHERTIHGVLQQRRTPYPRQITPCEQPVSN